jgi:excisionase family DNA binding protein
LQNAESSITLFGIMIKVSIREIAIKRGIKTAYQLQKLMDLQPSQAAKWFKNELKQIGIESLNSLCEALDCEPSDILKYSSGKVKAEKPVKVAVIAQEGTPSYDTTNDFLSTGEVAKRLGLNERTIRDNYKNGNLKHTKVGTKNFVSETDFQAFKAERNKMPSE